MKTLELELKKKIIIVEAPFKIFKTHYGYLLFGNNSQEIIQKQNKINKGDVEDYFKIGESKFICKGNELKEEIASQFVENFCADMNIPAYRNYAVKPEDLEDDHWAHVANDAVESLISAIESKNMLWGNHNIPYPSIYDPRSKTGRFEIGKQLEIAQIEYNEAQSKTFNPNHSLIFEILN